jgi:hypothetical protein
MIPPELLTRTLPIQRFVPLATIFGEGGFPPLRLGPQTYAPAAVRFAKQVMITGTLSAARPLVRELEALSALAAVPETDRFWHTSEKVFQRVIEVFAGVLSATWQNVYVLAGWGEAPEGAGFALALRFPNGRLLREAFGSAEPSAAAPAEVGWALEVVEAGTIVIRLAAREVVRWLIGLVKVALRSTERILDSWPELLDATLEDLGAQVKMGPLAVYMTPQLDTSTGYFNIDMGGSLDAGGGLSLSANQNLGPGGATLDAGAHYESGGVTLDGGLHRDSTGTTLQGSGTVESGDVTLSGGVQSDPTGTTLQGSGTVESGGLNLGGGAVRTPDGQVQTDWHIDSSDKPAGG